MNFSYYKYLIYIVNHGFTHEEDLKRVFHLTSTDIKNILSTLENNGYILKVHNYMYYPTYKGKTFLLSAICHWLYNNVLSIIAIIISIIALFK